MELWFAPPLREGEHSDVHGGLGIVDVVHQRLLLKHDLRVPGPGAFSGVSEMEICCDVTTGEAIRLKRVIPETSAPIDDGNVNVAEPFPVTVFVCIAIDISPQFPNCGAT